MKKHFFTLFLLLAALLLQAQNPARSGKDYALFFVVKDFDHWQDFSTESLDRAREIEQELKSNYGFLTDFQLNPGKQQILDKLDEYARRTFGKDDQLLLFFSMHGHYEEGRIGALIPKDGLLRDNAYQTWIMHPLLEDLVSAIPCEHTLLALDACYSGTFEGGRGKPQQLPFKTTDDCASKAQNALQYNSRLYLTSGGKERTPITSQFAEKWVEALRSRNADGVLSYTDLVGVLEDANPIPRSGEFKGHQNRGNFVFVNKFTCGNTPSIDKTADKAAWQTAKVANSLAAYKKYRSDFPNGEFRPIANQRIAEMEAVQQEELDWEAAKKANSAKAYDDFLRDYPDSDYKDVALFNRSQLETKKGSDAPLKNSTDLPGFVFVQGGDFSMGSKDGSSNETPHPVTLSDFYMARHELTVEEFGRFITATGTKTDADKDGGSYIWDGSSWTKTAGVNWKYDATGKVRPSSEQKHPVIHVSWNDAVAYCNWRSEQDGFQKVYTISGDKVTPIWNANGYRLPTEAEWEYAARSRGKDEKWAGTSTESSLASFANFWEDGSSDKDGYEYTAPVGSFKANALGLHDMSGNVWEWCWDWYGDYPTVSKTDPRGADGGSNRVLRGGSWHILPADQRCAYRDSDTPGSRDSDCGFRLSRAAR